MQDHFCAGIIFAFDEKDFVWKTLGSRDMRFADGEGIKVPGGTNKDKHKRLTNETPLETLIREMKEESRLSVLKSILAHSYAIKGRIPGSVHVKYFFLVKEFAGSLPFNEPFNFNDEGDEVQTKWYSLEEFEVGIFKFPNHKEGYVRAFLAKANSDEKFKNDNTEMYNRYSAMKFNK